MSMIKGIEDLRPSPTTVILKYEAKARKFTLRAATLADFQWMGMNIPQKDSNEAFQGVNSDALSKIAYRVLSDAGKEELAKAKVEIVNADGDVIDVDNKNAIEGADRLFHLTMGGDDLKTAQENNHNLTLAVRTAYIGDQKKK